MPGYFGVGSPADRTGRGLSSDLWNFGKYGGANLDRYLMGDLNVGYGFQDDFLDLPTGRHTVTQATQGTFALDDARYGIVLADCNSSTVTQGVNVQRAGSTGESFTPIARTNIWFEARVKAADLGSSGPEFFLGLAVIDTTIIATSALSAQLIGFSSVTDNSILLATCKDGSGATTGTGHTFVDGTWVKLGFRVTDVGTVEFFVNGVKVSTITANIPTTDLVPSVVVQSDGAVDTILHMDWWAAFCNDTLLGSAS